MIIRLRSLRLQYPALTIESFAIVSQETTATSSILSRAIMDNLDLSEIFILTQGRNCTESECITAFVDDFRCERRIITTTAIEWYRVTAALRGSAQIFVWTRLGMLVYVVNFTQHLNRRSFIQRLSNSILSIVKIPFHTVVYGSLIPIMLYVVA